MEHSQVLTIWVRVDLEVILMKRYSTFPKFPGLELYHPMVKCNNQDTRNWWGSLLLGRRVVYVFFSPTFFRLARARAHTHTHI